MFFMKNIFRYYVFKKVFKYLKYIQYILKTFEDTLVMMRFVTYQYYLTYCFVTTCYVK